VQLVEVYTRICWVRVCSQLGAFAGLQTTRLCKMSVDSVIGELFNDAVATECRQGRAGLVILACTLQFEC
jgi:hypothetical protein